VPLRLRSLPAQLLPHGPLDALRQVLLFAIAYYAYRYTRGFVDDPQSATVAFENARSIIHIEQTLGLFVEPSVQAWSSSVPVLQDFTSWMYINAQSTVTLAALVYLYLFHNASFYFVRNMFVVAWIIAIVGYIVLPTAPPRFLPEWGFFDSVADFTGVAQDSVTVNALFNPYAAVPSMHVGFALMIGIPLAKLSRHRVTRIAWALYPLLVTFVIVATANHFIADAVLGAAVAAVSAYSAAWLARARPEVWRFGRRSAELTA
jgi:hypothetical protein